MPISNKPLTIPLVGVQTKPDKSYAILTNYNSIPVGSDVVVQRKEG